MLLRLGAPLSVLSRLGRLGRCYPPFSICFRSRFYASEAPTSFITVSMPALSPTMKQGNLVKWRVLVGGAVRNGDVLAEIETDKATIEFESPEDGYLASQLVQEGAHDIPVGKPIAVIVEDEKDLGKAYPVTDPYASSAPSLATAVSSSSTVSISASKSGVESVSPVGDSTFASRISPAVRMLLDDHGLSLKDVIGSGPHGLVLKGDVLKHIAQGPQKKSSISVEPISPTSSGVAPSASPTKTVSSPDQSGDSRDRRGFRDVKASQMRRVIANRLTESKQTKPHSYMLMSLEVDGALDLRKMLKDLGSSVTINDLLIKACGICVMEFPEMRKQVLSDGSIQEENCSDISVAVATPAGLLTPIIRDAASSSLSSISSRMKDLATRARGGKLLPEEYQGGVFSISNLGMSGISEFTAVMNPPQSAILAVGSSEVKPKISESGEMGFTTTMDVHLSFDERAVSSESAARFLDRLNALMKQPSLML